MSKRGNGEGSIYKDGDRWVAAIVTTEEGRRVRRKFTGTTRRQVADRLAEALRAQAQGLPVSADCLGVGKYLAEWLEQTARPRLRARPFQSYRMVVERHLVPILGSLRLAQLSPRHVQSYMAAKQKEGLSARTVQYHHAILRRALHDAERVGLVQRNVARLVSPPRVQRAEMVPPTVSEVRAFFTSAAGDRDEALFTLAVATGLRQSEVLGLTWADLDFESHSLSVRRTLQRYAGAYHLDEPKTERSRRTLHMAEPVEVALRAHRVRQLEERLRAGDQWQDAWKLVFTDEFGAPRSGIQLTRRYQALLGRAGLPRQRFHDLRHAAATFMLTQGVGLRTAMEVLGHSQIHVTANTYSHVMPELKEDAAKRVSALLFGGDAARAAAGENATGR